MLCVNYKDVGRDNPNEPAGEEIPDEPGDVPVDDPNPTISDSQSPRGMDVLIEHYNMTQEHQITRFVDENLNPHVKSTIKTLTGRLRRGVFDMRAKTLQCILGEGKTDVEARRLIEATCFQSELSTIKKGVVNSWEELVNKIEWVINFDDKNTNPTKEKVDMPDSRAIKATWLSDFFTEIQKLVYRKKQSVLKILEDSDSLEAAATEIRGMFNRSLNEIGPMVKAEVRRIVVLVLNSAN
jgi:hypothetical protein